MKEKDKVLQALCDGLGENYKLMEIDLELCIYRDFGNRFEVEVSGVHTAKQNKKATIYLWCMHYNPFHYIHSEKDILKLVNTIMVNTKGEGEKSSEDFWTKAERLLYCALIGYIWYEAPEEEQNFATLLEFINASETREDDETFKNAVDMLFEELEKEEPEHFAVRQYKKYKLAAGVVSLKRLLNQSNLKSWSSKMIKKSLEAYFFTLKNKIVFCKKQFQNMSVFCFVSTEIV